MISYIDVSDKIERLEVFEERLGVRLEALSAFIESYGDDTGYIRVKGELHACDGMKLQQNICLVMAAYDSAGRIVGTRSEDHDAEKFYGLETFEILTHLPVIQISRVRIYPKKSE